MSNQEIQLSPAQQCQQLIVRAEQSIAPACTGDLTWARLQAAFGSALMKEPKLVACTPASLVLAVTQAAQTQLSPDGLMNEACIIAFNKVATFVPMYNGLIKVAVRSGNVINIDASAIYETDVFDYEHGTDPKITHKPDWEGVRNMAQLKGVYAVAHFRDGNLPMPEVIGIVRLKQILASSKQSSRWTSSDNNWEEWCKKTAIRRLCKRLPASADLRQVIDILDEIEGKSATELVEDKGTKLDELLGVKHAPIEGSKVTEEEVTVALNSSTPIERN